MKEWIKINFPWLVFIYRKLKTIKFDKFHHLKKRHIDFFKERKEKKLKYEEIIRKRDEIQQILSYSFNKISYNKPKEISEIESIFLESKASLRFPKEEHILNKYFDKIYIINLIRRPDRKSILFQKIKKLGIDVEFVEAEDGYNKKNFVEFKKRYFRSIYFKNYINYLFNTKENFCFISEPGELGCLYSHLKVLKDAVNNNYKKILILEDDILFINDFSKHFNSFINSIPIDWKIIGLGASQHNWNIVFSESSIYTNESDLLKNHWYQPFYTDGAFALGIDSSLFNLIINKIQNNNLVYDSGIIKNIYEEYKGKCFISFPNLIIADVINSDIRVGREIFSHANKMKWDLLLYDYPFTPKLISVIMPAFNAGKTIEKSIYSILNQSYKNIELIVVNDGSSDNTEDIIRKIARLDNRIKFINNSENKGCYYSRNEALRISSGEYITIADSDDISLSHRLSKQIYPLLTGEAEFTIGLCLRSRCEIDDINIDNEAEMLSKVYANRKINKHGGYDYADREVLGLMTTMFDRKIFEKIGLFWEERFSGDTEILERYMNIKHGLLLNGDDINIHTLLYFCDPIPGTYKRIDELLLISPNMKDSNLSNKFPIKSEKRIQFQKKWRLRLQGKYNYNYPTFI